MAKLPFGDPRIPHDIWNRVRQTEDGCWLVEGPDNGNGYIRVTVDGKRRYLHHLVTDLELGPMPPGMLRDHTCHDPQTCRGGSTCAHRRCMRHVTFIPAAENTSRARSVSRTAEITHCPQGHPYNEQNTISPPSMKGRRVCRTCRNTYTRQYRAHRRRRAALDELVRQAGEFNLYELTAEPRQTR
jgi:hypothetical protein